MLEIVGSLLFFLLAAISFLYLQKKIFESSHSEGKRTLESLVHPLKESLDKFERQVHELERHRVGAYASLTENLKTLASNQLLLEKETKNLTKALRAPHVRGLWGEIQLKRIVELAGMLEYCDFTQQETLTGEIRLRPDMIIRLPGEKSLIVDSKTPLSAYLDALEAPDDAERSVKLKEHARQIRTHIQQLSAKSYFSYLKFTPEFVILFIPGEPLLSSALEHDPSLMEYSIQSNIILATPMTLIATLRAIAHSWRQEQVAKNALQITELGKTLHERLFTFLEHYHDMKKGLDKTVDAYNKSLASLENRVLVTARKLKDLTHPQEDLPILPAIEKIPVEAHSSCSEKEAFVNIP